MGCDVHLVLEKKVDGKWIGMHDFRGFESRFDKGRHYPAAGTRNYRRFAAMAGVRGEGPASKGVPEDASDLTKHLVHEWDGDGHSHSWLTLADAAKLYNEVRYEQEEPLDPDSYQAKYPASYWFDVEDDHAKDYRLVFWFDN